MLIMWAPGLAARLCTGFPGNFKLPRMALSTCALPACVLLVLQRFSKDIVYEAAAMVRNDHHVEHGDWCFSTCQMDKSHCLERMDHTQPQSSRDVGMMLHTRARESALACSWLTGSPLSATAAFLQTTSEAVHQLLQQHSATIAALQRQLLLLQALSQPDPAPKAWDLCLRTEALTYFITEAALDPQETGSNSSQPKLFAEPLGLGAQVPRFLRWDGSIELQEMGQQQLHEQICRIWQGKAEYEALHGPVHLQTYLQHHFAAAAAAAAAASVLQPSAAATPAAAGAGDASSLATGTGTSSSSNKHMDVSSSMDPCAVEASRAAAVTQAAVAAGYQLYHALRSHRQASVAADTMWQVLTGQLPEAVLAEQQQQLQGLVMLLQEIAAVAAAAAAAGAGGISSETAGRGSASAVVPGAGSGTGAGDAAVQPHTPAGEYQGRAGAPACMQTGRQLQKVHNACSTSALWPRKPCTTNLAGNNKHHHNSMC